MYVKVCADSEIREEGVMYRFEVDGRAIMIAKLDNEGIYFAASPTCTHQEADLSLGILSGSQITCPLHQAKFDIRTGKVIEGPDGEEAESISTLETFATKVENGVIWVDL